MNEQKARKQQVSRERMLLAEVTATQEAMQGAILLLICEEMDEKEVKK